MIYTMTYQSPVGELLIAERGGSLIGLWLSGQKYFLGSVKKEAMESRETPVLAEAAIWLDRYFRGEKPPVAELHLAPEGSEFRRTVWELLCEIPYGETTTYGELAEKAAARLGLASMSAQAVGGAVGHNPISIIIPCHRVMGKNGSLTGYAGGIDKKVKLLEYEGVRTEGMKLPDAADKSGKKAVSIKIEASRHSCGCRWKDGKIRCFWANPDNDRYLLYHDEEWGVPVYDDHKLFEMLILESFQAGLSWECILNKQEAFRKAFDDFDLGKVCDYREEKIEELLQNPGIVRNRLKIRAAVKNAGIFREIQREYGSFSNYIWHFTEGKVIRETGLAFSPLSDAVSRDLKKRGMTFVGTTIIYAYLQAIGVINSHEEECFLAP